MKTTKKKLGAVLLTLAMLLSLLPLGAVTALAEGAHTVEIGSHTNGSVAVDPESAVKGTSITLTFTPNTGYALQSVEVLNGTSEVLYDDYPNASINSVIVRSFPMPDENVTVNAIFVNEPETLQEKLNNNSGKTVSLTAQTDSSSLTINNTVTLDLNGYTLNCSSITVSNTGNLTIKDSQTGGKIDTFGGVTVNGSFTQSGGTITGTESENPGVAIGNGGSFTMTGGTITGNRGGGVEVESGATFYVSGSASVFGNKYVDNDLPFDETDCNVNLLTSSPSNKINVTGPLSGTIGVTKEGGVSGSVAAAAGSGYTLAPADVARFSSDDSNFAVGLSSGKAILCVPNTVTVADVSNGSVTADSNVVPQGLPVTLTVTPSAGYAIDTVSYNDGSNHTITPVEGVYSFTMPAKNVTVNATFTKLTEPVFRSQSLVLSGQIGVNFFLDLSALTEAEKATSYMTFSITHGTTTERDNFDANHMSQSGRYYGFTCYVNSIQMAETITATFHYTQGGESKTMEKTYSVKEYMYTYDENSMSVNEKMAAVIQAVADYGHYIQPFLAWANGWVVGTDYAEMDKFYTESFTIADVASAVSNKDFVTDKTGEDIEKITFNLILDSETTLCVYFKPAAGYSGRFSATVGGQPAAATLQTDGRYVVSISNISAHQLSTTYNIAVTTNNGGATVSVSALSYVKAMLDNYTGVDDGFKQAAAAALYQYSHAADVYKAANNT